MSLPAPQNDEPNLLHAFGLIAGGLCLGFGLLSLYYSFGADGYVLNGNAAAVGFSGLDNIGLRPAAEYSIGMVVAGMLVLILLNAGAWRRTGGY